MELNKVYCMDALEGLRQLPDAAVDLVLLDPPFDVSTKSYEPKLSEEKYCTWFREVLRESYRVLRPEGFLILDSSIKRLNLYLSLPQEQFTYVWMIVGYGTARANQQTSQVSW